MKTLLCLLLLCLPLLSHAQGTPILTETYPSPDGSRTLDMRGLFENADTVLVQVYHDGDLIHEDVRIYTWAITLGEYQYYTLKFTDEKHRVKYLYIIELGDNVIEYVGEIIINFKREGNLLLLKPSDGKPDFMQIDVGLSRQH